MPATGTIAIADGSNLSYQGEVTFDTTVEGLKGKQYPMVYVACYQDGEKVWGTLKHPDEVFELGGDSSQWIVNGGGPAECEASIRAYGGKQDLILGTVTFDAEG